MCVGKRQLIPTREDQHQIIAQIVASCQKRTYGNFGPTSGVCHDRPWTEVAPTSSKSTCRYPTAGPTYHPRATAERCRLEPSLPNTRRRCQKHGVAPHQTTEPGPFRRGMPRIGRSRTLSERYRSGVSEAAYFVSCLDFPRNLPRYRNFLLLCEANTAASTPASP